MTRAAIQPDIFMGWARCAVAEGMIEPPLYVKQAASPLCTDVATTWNRLIQIEQRRQKLVKGEIDPRDVCEYSSGWEAAEQELHRQAIQYAVILSWGDR